jgi:hypothetical protein
MVFHLTSHKCTRIYSRLGLGFADAFLAQGNRDRFAVTEGRITGNAFIVSLTMVKMVTRAVALQSAVNTPLFCYELELAQSV